MVEGLARDLKGSVRRLAASPIFGIMAVLLLALGIGASTAFFSVVDGVLIDDLPYRDPDRLLSVAVTGLGDFRDLRVGTRHEVLELWRQAGILEDLAGYRGTSASVVGPDGPRSLSGIWVDPNLFTLLGVAPELGGILESSSDPSHLVLSYRVWRDMFRQDGDVVGESVLVDGRPFTVVGVMPQEFTFPNDETDYWIPFNGSHWGVMGIARLPEDLTQESAVERLSLVMDRWRVQEGAGDQDVSLLGWKAHRTGEVQKPLWTLWAAMLFVLLLACSNLADLLLVRATAYRQDVAVRRALGGSRWLIVRPFMVDSLLLAALGCWVSVPMAMGFLEGFRRILPTDLPRLENIELGFAEWAFAALLAVLCGLVCGAFPALHMSRGSAMDLRSSARMTRADRKIQGGLAVAEIALAVVLLTGAGLLLRSYYGLSQVDKGFETENLVSFRVKLPSTPSYDNAEKRAAFHDRLGEQLARIPGIEATGRTSYLPVLGRTGFASYFNVMGKSREDTLTLYRIVSPGYLPMIRSRLLAGRWLTETDGPDHGSPSVLINESLADEHWPGWRGSEGNGPLGSRIRLGAVGDELVESADVVGVIADMKDIDLAADTRSVLYIHEGFMRGWRLFDHVVSTALEPSAAMPMMRQALATVDPQIASYELSTLTQRVDESLSLERASVVLGWAFAGVAWILAVFGIFGVTAQWVSGQKREIALRMAVGAAPGQLRRWILGRSFRQTAIGLGLGLLLSAGLAQLLRSMLFNVSGLGLTEISTVLFGLALATWLATWGPLRRALRIEPSDALRES